MSGARFDQIFGDAQLLLLLALESAESTVTAKTDSAILQSIPGIEVAGLEVPCGAKISARLEVAVSEDVAAGSVGAWVIEIEKTDGMASAPVPSIEMPCGVTTVPYQVTVSTVKSICEGTYTVRAMHKRISGTSMVQTETAVLTVEVYADEEPPCLSISP